MAGIVAEDICMAFETKGQTVAALENVNLTIESGEFVSIVGPTSCGKTTFLRIACGLVQPTSGRISFGGGDSRRPGMVFQEDSLLPWRTLLDNVAFGLQIRGRTKQARREIAQKYIDLVGLDGFENRYPYELSGGMRQRANLARGLAIDPDILLMDEPFASLDAQTREIMQFELLTIWERTGKTVLFITHQIDEAVYLADRVIVFSGRPGKVKAEFTIDMPRPRALGVKRTAKFIEYIDKIWKLLEQDVKRGLTTTTSEE
ncbi:MAG: ABC transporter ATP-binding protein [Dehalococcoidia bacterium]